MHDQKSTSGQSTGNFLLDSLPIEEFEQLRQRMEPHNLPAGKVYAEFCDPLRHAFFPAGGMLCMIAEAEDGRSCEAGFIGFEGMVGLPVILGRNEMPYKILVQVAADGYRVNLEAVKQLFAQQSVFHDRLLEFGYVVLKQFAQTAL